VEGAATHRCYCKVPFHPLRALREQFGVKHVNVRGAVNEPN
jgi:hypothetical protein